MTPLTVALGELVIVSGHIPAGRSGRTNVTEPIFWLAVSLVLVAVCLAAVLVAAIPAFIELARAARSAEKLFDTLGRELPPTLEAIRLTGLEISDLTDDISQGVESAGNVVKQVDQGIAAAKRQVQEVKVTTRSVFAGVKAAWQTWNRPSRKPSRLPPSQLSPPPERSPQERREQAKES
ncbi:MAG: hypothetical protein P3X23_010930 [Thermosynechococcus sp. Uc]|nr:hypothetical protein [Thermosynechococcus sp. Uc]MDM7327609.1 hypothetical protein [Thermosynechococcus sp. Uc]